MNALKQLPDTSISKVYSTLVGGVIATSIVVMGNGAVSIGQNYDCTGQIVCHYDEKTTVYASFSKGSAFGRGLFAMSEKAVGCHFLLFFFFFLSYYKNGTNAFFKIKTKSIALFINSG